MATREQKAWNKDGPTIFQSMELRCGMCRHHSQSMQRSGRNPIYHHFCTHPNAGEGERIGALRRGHFIGESDHTPDWCPAGKEKTESEADDGE